MKRILSGIKPTGELTLGNYIGAIKRFVELQQSMPEDEFYLFIADLHAITVPQDTTELRRRTRDIAAMYIAAGLDPERTVLFIQSEVKEHAELGYLLQCYTHMGELERMTQYKDKIKKGESNLTSALFTYPALMAADILIYDADYVPVGDDQKQHVELTRDIATRFNNRYRDFFRVPEPIIPKVGARIMDLQDPSKKMSKSDDNSKGYIALLDDLQVIKKKIKSAVTDSLGIVQYDPDNQPGIANLLSIYSVLSEKSIDDIVLDYASKGYADFKNDLAELVAEKIGELQKKYNEVIQSGTLDSILDKGKETASRVAYRKVEKCKQIIGLGRKR
ncbi:MAG: tryptophan--tRNA ligase [Tenericutes bacterium HGW-Tenericutes-1]|jgi:tryptophanyl-tRNA synthetase|nr:MAG: tryptophan--tRNA ligase [Tenericutes bacterium HGW-Tenericutes-1]